MAATSWPGIWFWLILLTLLVLACVVPIGVGFSFEQKEKARLWLLLSLGGLMGARVRLPTFSSMSKEPQSSAAPDQVAQPAQGEGAAAEPFFLRAARWVRIAKRAYAISRPVLRRIERLEWRTELGTGDAAVTSLLVGSLWALKSTVIGALARNHTFVHAPRLLVAPNYNKARFSLEIRCIFRFTVGDIIVAALKSFARPKRG